MIYVCTIDRILSGGGGFPRRQQASTNDKGLNGPIPWYDLAYVPKGWRTITVPAFWEDQGVKDLNGTVWYGKEIDVPASMVGNLQEFTWGESLMRMFYTLTENRLEERHPCILNAGIRYLQIR